MVTSISARHVISLALLRGYLRVSFSIGAPTASAYDHFSRSTCCFRPRNAFNSAPTCTHLSLNTWLIISMWLQFRFRLIVAPTTLFLSRQQLLCVYTQYHGLSRAFRVIIVFGLFVFPLHSDQYPHSSSSQFQITVSSDRLDSIYSLCLLRLLMLHQFLCTFSSACYRFVPRLHDFTSAAACAPYRPRFVLI